MKRYLTVLIMGILSAFSTVHAFTVHNSKIFDANNQPVSLRGVNWSGFETQDHVLHGLWARNWQDMLKQIKASGFTALRIPVCPATLQGVATNSIDYSKNSDLQGLNSVQILDKFMATAEQLQLYVLLDHHRPDCAAISTLWYTDSYSETQWLADLTTIATRYKTNAYLIGIDIKNEPHGNATWGSGNIATDWNTAAEKAASTILKANPNLLIFVEGIESASQCSGQLSHWWGGNLEPAQCTPLIIDKTKLVFAPHVYGPDVHQQSYFQDSTFPNNLEAIWQAHFGFLHDAGFAVIVGEFGGHYGHGGDAKDKIWQDTFVNYLIKKEMRDFFYWTWNPNSGDTGGILQDDWQTVWSDKIALLTTLTGGTAPSQPTEPATNPNNSNNSEATETTTAPNPVTPPSVTPPTVTLDKQACEINATIQSQWQNGMVINVVLRNKSTTDLKNWQVGFRLAEGVTIGNYWNISLSEQVASPLDWNRTILTNQQAEFGLQLAFNALPATPFELQNVSCGNTTAATAPVASQSADYQKGRQEGITFCQENPAACNIPSCNTIPLYQPNTGALFLPHLGLTTDNSNKRWDIVLQQLPNSMTFEVRSITPVQ